MGAGTVHHIAFRSSDDSTQLDWQQELGRHVSVTWVQDRTYFHSIYFREPVESLGEALRILEWLEPQRSQIEARVKPITLRKMNAEAKAESEMTR